MNDRAEAWSWMLDALPEHLGQRLREECPEVEAAHLRFHKITTELEEALKEAPPELQALIETRDHEIYRLHDLETTQSYFLGARDCVAMLKWIGLL